jgi:hypothetical protein
VRVYLTKLIAPQQLRMSPRNRSALSLVLFLFHATSCLSSSNHPFFEIYRMFRETRRVVGTFYYDSISGWTDTPLLFVTRVVDKTKNRLETFCFYTNQVRNTIVCGQRDAVHHS